MRPRRPVLLKFSTISPDPTHSPLTSLESALPQVLILNNLKSFRINTNAKPRGRGPHPFPPSNPKFTPKGTSRLCEPTIFRTFFQVPYALSPLFATLTKTAGVHLLSSHFGTCTSPLATRHLLDVAPRQTPR